MRVHEYQAKELLRRFGVSVPQGRMVTTPEEARAAAAELKRPVVLKAQIHAGGRGKAGGIKPASSPEEAEAIARTLLGTRLVTPQTPPGGRLVTKLLVEEAVSVELELYLSILLDRAAARPLVMASAAGGMDIEEVAARSHELILKAHVDPTTGFQPYQGRKLGFAMGVEPLMVPAVAQLMVNLYRAFIQMDCSLAEINPLVITKDKSVLALDAKISFDDSALYRHPDVAALRDPQEEDPLEVKAAEYGFNYVKLNGDIGCVVNGAGLAMATMDLIKLVGGQPANFLDVVGVGTADRMVDVFRVLAADAQVKAVLVNIFGGIVRVDAVGAGLLQAKRELGLTFPIVARLAGTNAAEGLRILAQAKDDIILASDLLDAAQKVVMEAQRAKT